MLFGVLCLSSLVLFATADKRPSEHGHRMSGPRTVRCAHLCSLLQNRFPGQVSFPNATAYTTGQQYWSLQQSHTEPACRFNPTCAEEVSEAVIEVKRTQCPFAVKSGGHAAFRGGSNIQAGLTIDLSGLNGIEVTSDKKLARLGTGSRWEAVYAKLDPMGIAVVGGRNGDIGVGGLTLGGGISYFSGFRGWACDNVENYEVVLANGKIVNASPSTHPDLFFALRGGGNNFGIVTRMDLTTLPQGKMWGGENYAAMSTNASYINALYWFNKNNAQDPHAHTFIAAACVAGMECLFTAGLYNSKPVVSPPILANFTAIPTTLSTNRITDLSDLTAELKAAQPPGFYQAWFTLTIQNDYQLLYDILNSIWYPATAPLINTTAGFVGTIAYQPLTEAIIENFGKNGGNALGVNGSTGPLVIMGMDFQWSNPSDGAKVVAVQQYITDKSHKLAEERGLSHPYLYQNYAYETQDVFAGYGEKSLNKLLKVRNTYDPDGVFTDLQPGYFKLQPGKRVKMGPDW